VDTKNKTLHWDYVSLCPGTHKAVLTGVDA
jgi:hypothetical protein